MRIRQRTVSEEIPTSSMADITFLLIVYFMVSSTFAATRGLDVSFPNEEVTEIDPVESVLVEVVAPGALVVDGRSMALGDLLEYLQPKLARDPGKPVILKAANEVTYGAMVGALDELRQGRTLLGLDREINVALPTEREQAIWWR